MSPTEFTLIMTGITLVLIAGALLWLPFPMRGKPGKSRDHLRSLDNNILSMCRLFAVLGLLIGFGFVQVHTTVGIFGFCTMVFCICYIPYYKAVTRK